MKHIKRVGVYSDIKLLKGFDKKEAEVRVIGVTNISCLYFLERNSTLAEDCSDIYVNTS